MHTLAELDHRRFQAVRAAAMSAPVDGISFRVLVGMLSNLDIPHWTARGEMLTFVGLDRLERITLTSKTSVAKARRKLAGWGLIVRLTPPELRGQPTVFLIHASPLVPLPFPARMRQALTDRKRQKLATLRGPANDEQQPGARGRVARKADA
jgi:hypothetical protein